MMASMPVALMPFLQNSRVAALSKRLRADSSSAGAPLAAAVFLFGANLLMAPVNRTAALSSSGIFERRISAPKMIVRPGVCTAFGQAAADHFQGRPAKGLKRFAF